MKGLEQGGKNLTLPSSNAYDPAAPGHPVAGILERTTIYIRKEIRGFLPIAKPYSSEQLNRLAYRIEGLDKEKGPNRLGSLEGRLAENAPILGRTSL